ncbi:hypothetical protein [Robertmurraya sp. FSL R5-0851]|uniref:hypothetical protein n=1 Tax=Robertmurraya sp. FSL R5-0851 TaxID=2921584 RepID=UPI0030FD055F
MFYSFHDVSLLGTLSSIINITLIVQVHFGAYELEAERKRKDTELNLTERLEVEKINTQRKVILEEIESLESNHTENIGLISKVYSFFSPFKPTK